MLRSKRSNVVRYGAVLLLMGAVIIITEALPLVPKPSFPLFLAAILFCTWFGGLGPGLVATAFATLASLDLAEPPLGSFHLTNEATPLRLVLFFVSALVVLLIAAEGERARHELHRLNLQLEQRVRERTAQLENTNLELKRQVAERKEAEERINQLNRALEQRAVELEIANKELEAFSYSISHDLRAPLAGIEGFSRTLLQDDHAQLPESSRRFVQLIRENAAAMSRLIQDLLVFSRTTRQPLQKQTVSTQALVREVVAELQGEQAGRTIEWALGDLPACQADAALLKQVWVNLLSNALKFTRRCDVTRIEIGSRREGEVGVYFIRDNGAGFDMQRAATLFGVFRRFHSEEDYEGTGVGLAIVERIIRRHGGKVWAEAAVDKGATFYFTVG